MIKAGEEYFYAGSTAMFEGGSKSFCGILVVELLISPADLMNEILEAKNTEFKKACILTALNKVSYRVRFSVNNLIRNFN